ELQNLTLKGDYAAALALQDRLMPLFDAMFVETNPGPVKYAVSRLGFCTEDMRLPMVPVSVETRRIVDAAMARAGVTAKGGALFAAAAE
ncbi:MAG: dihydrodipicolinate synthase family protein, partial [Hyphomicrobiaceae bacterium]